MGKTEGERVREKKRKGREKRDRERKRDREKDRSYNEETIPATSRWKCHGRQLSLLQLFWGRVRPM